MPSVLAQAAAETGDLRAVVGILGADPKKQRFVLDTNFVAF
jgi:hypothetical protein